MPNLTMSIPHQLGRAEARRRIETGLAQMLQQYGNMLSHVEHHWTGDTVNLSVSALAQTVSGRAIVEEQVVRVEVELPWLLAMLTGKVRQAIEQQGQKLLEHKKSS